MSKGDGKHLKFFDSHCHLTSPRFRGDLGAVMERAAKAGVTHWVTIASNLEDARRALALVEGRTGSWSTAGIHPHEVGSARRSDLVEIRELALDPKVVAIGETGLDYYYDNAPRDVQRAWFDRHLELAWELDLPVIVHSREADGDVARAISSAPRGTRGVLHCFTGGELSFLAAMEADWYISLSGVASFKSFRAQDLVLQVPPNRLLVETDAPYLSPVPHRGRRNEPSRLVSVAGAVASILRQPLEEVAIRTMENAQHFYGV